MNFKKAVCFSLILVIIAGLFLRARPAQAISDTDLYLKNNAKVTISPDTYKIPCPIKKVEDLRYSGKWDVIVDGSNEGQSTAIKNLIKGERGKGKADQYNFVQYGKIGQWASVLNGDTSFVYSKAGEFQVNISGSSRIYLGYLAELCGGYVAKYRAYGDEGETGKIWLGTTPKPRGQISVPSFAQEGESVKIRLSGQTFSKIGRDVARAVEVDSKQTIITFNIDGKSIFSGKSISSNSYSETISHKFSEGRHTLTLFIKDNVNRYTRIDKTIDVGGKPLPPPPPGNVSANISMTLSPNNIKEGKTANVKVSLDASNSRSSGSGPFHYRWWVKKNGRYITSKDGVNTKENSYYDITESKVSPGDTFWAKVKVYDFSINKADDAETERSVFEEGEEPPDPEPIPEPPEPPSPPIPVPPVADFDMPEKRSAGSEATIINKSKNNNGFTRYDGYWLDSKWDILPSDGVDTGKLGQAGGKVLFNKDGIYDVTLTVTDNKGMSDTTSKQIKINNSPPKIKIQAPDEVLQGVEVFISSDYHDPDMNIDLKSFNWSITPVDGRSIDEPLEDGNIDSFNCLFDNVGEYEIKVTIKDTCGLTATDTHKIKVLPVIPEAYFSFQGSHKENRKLVFDSSGSSSIERYPVDWSKNEWEFVPQTEGVTDEDIKIVNSEDVRTRTVMFKKPGDYKVRLRVTNEAGNASEWFEQIIRIYPDEPPVADFYVQSTVLRNPEDNNKAKIELIDSSYSPDGDEISQRIWRYKYDSNNDGNFDEEQWQILDSGNNINPVLYTDQVGKYLFELYVKEEFGEETIPEFLTPEDMRDADTADKAIDDKKCEVENLQPVVDFDVITKPKVDLVVKGVTNSSWASRFSPESNSFINNISGKGFDVKHDIKLEQKTIKTRTARKGEIYFRSYRYPFSGWEEYLHSTNYDYKTNIGKFNRTLYYSNNIGNSNFNSLYITVEELQAVPEDQYYPSYEPRVYYSYDGSTWHKVSISYNNRYGDWQSLGTGEYTKRAFEFDSDYIRDDVRYIKVLNHNGYADRDDIVYVRATAYGNEEYTAYANLDDNKFTEELERSWQDDSQKYVIIISDCSDDIGNVYDIINGYITKGIKVVFVGAASLKTLGEQIAQGTGGAYFQFSGSNIPWDEIAKYLEKELLKQKTITKYVLLNEEVEYKTFYNDTENDSIISDRWIYTHDPHYFENSLGLADFSDKYISLPIEKFDKVGKYKVIYQARDNPKNDSKFDNYRLWSHMPLSNLEIYVHRKPIAQFTAPLEKEGSKYKINISSTSYDLDHMSEPNKGIVEEKWRWKEYNSINWNEGKPSFIGQREKMLVSLEVKDLEGAWSDPYVQIISTEAKALPPVAMFTVDPTVQIRYGEMVITDQSYDPGGYEITNREWRVKSPDGTWKNRGSTVPNDIVNMGLGEYKIELKVRNSKGLWSEPFVQTVKIIEGNKKPIARFTIGPNPIIADEAYTLKDTSYDPDGDPIVAREWKIQKPNGAWVNISEWKPTFEEMGFDDDGVYKIGLRVKDDPTGRYSILEPLWSDWYYQTVTVESPLKVIGDSDKNVYRAGQAMLLTAETEGKAFRVEAKMWYPKNEFASTNITTLLADKNLSDPPQKKMTWHTRRTKAEGRDIVVIIPLKTPDGTYPVTFTAYKRKYDGGVKTATHTINVKVKGTVYDHSHSEIIGPFPGHQTGD